jgi:hypothetical protein
MTQDELKKQVKYNPETGEFFRLGYYCRWGTFVNRISALNKYSKEGYLIVSINGIRFKAHRLAFLYVDNVKLENADDVDHVNGNKSDNRYCNLKICSREENMKNKPLYNNNSTGVIGVSRYEDKFRARITVDGKRVSLGLFETIEEAAEVRLKYEKKFNYSEHHGRKNEDQM